MLLFNCSCGRRYAVYLSKGRLTRRLGLSPAAIEAADQADREERAAGELAAGRELARLTGATFWNTDETPVIVCGCGSAIEAESLAEHWDRSTDPYWHDIREMIRQAEEANGEDQDRA